jgi:hypothetical protein
MTKISFLLEILIVGLLFEDPRLGMRHFFAIAVTLAPVTSEICGATGGSSVLSRLHGQQHTCGLVCGPKYL